SPDGRLAAVLREGLPYLAEQIRSRGVELGSQASDALQALVIGWHAPMLPPKLWPRKFAKHLDPSPWTGNIIGQRPSPNGAQQMTFAEILATDENFTQEGVEDFASFMEPDQAAAFLAKVAEVRQSL